MIMRVNYYQASEQRRESRLIYREHMDSINLSLEILNTTLIQLRYNFPALCDRPGTEPVRGNEKKRQSLELFC